MIEVDVAIYARMQVQMKAQVHAEVEKMKRTVGYSSGGRRGFDRAARKQESTSTTECGVHLGKAVLSSSASLIKAIYC